MLLGQQEAGAEWHVRWVGFSLNQTKVAEGDTDVWDDPEMASARLAVEVGIAVRDGWPDAFPAVHRALFAARHEQGLDADQVFDEVLSGRPRDVFRVEHENAVREHNVFGVPTIITGGQSVFVRLMNRPGEDGPRARDAVERCLDLATGWPELNEFKHSSIPH